jgi:anti-sigma regulatory factor (Ser/Thr protein kinase)
MRWLQALVPAREWPVGDRARTASVLLLGERHNGLVLSERHRQSKMSTLRRPSGGCDPLDAGRGHPLRTSILFGVPEASLTFPAELGSVGAARQFLRATLLGWGNGNYEFAAPLVLTELVTNATLHARTPYTVLLRLEPTHLLMEVVDSSPRLPQARNYAVDAATGRGIKIVNSLSATWGARPTPEGKVVWAQVRPDEPNMRIFTEADREPAAGPAVADAADRPAAVATQREETGHDAVDLVQAAP